MSMIPKAVTILRDDNGAFYLLTPELLEQARATPELQAEIEAALAADDTGGYLLPYLEQDPFAMFSIVSPRDPASGLPTGIVSPRDVATGQATGRRQYTP